MKMAGNSHLQRAAMASAGQVAKRNAAAKPERNTTSHKLTMSFAGPTNRKATDRLNKRKPHSKQQTAMKATRGHKPPSKMPGANTMGNKQKKTGIRRFTER